MEVEDALDAAGGEEGEVGVVGEDAVEDAGVYAAGPGEKVLGMKVKGDMEPQETQSRKSRASTPYWFPFCFRFCEEEAHSPAFKEELMVGARAVQMARPSAKTRAWAAQG